MLTVAEAVAATLAEVGTGLTEMIALENCHGRILALDVSTPHDSPLFDKSLMDGFAVRTADFVNDDASGRAAADSRQLSIKETVTAGMLPAGSLGSGTAIRIMTGAALPEGADCVVPIEQARFDEDRPEVVEVPQSAVSRERCILRRGAIATQHSLLLTAGMRLTPQAVAAMAEFGVVQIPVFRRPTVAIMATGNELVPTDHHPEPGQIRNSNEPMLVAQIQQSGGNPVALGIVRDQVADLHQQIIRGLQHDILLLTGGVSMGTLDLVPETLTAAGVQCVFHGVRMKPGKPLWFGVHSADEASSKRRCLVFGLPGNPVSSMVCFELFVQTAIRRMLGIEPAQSPVHSGRLDAATVVTGNRPVYHPARARLTSEGLMVTILPWSGSSDLRATAGANAMALLLPEPGRYAAGDVVDVYLWAPDPFA